MKPHRNPSRSLIKREAAVTLSLDATAASDPLKARDLPSPSLNPAALSLKRAHNRTSTHATDAMSLTLIKSQPQPFLFSSSHSSVAPTTSATAAVQVAVISQQQPAFARCRNLVAQ